MTKKSRYESPYPTKHPRSKREIKVWIYHRLHEGYDHPYGRQVVNADNMQVILSRTNTKDFELVDMARHDDHAPTIVICRA